MLTSYHPTLDSTFSNPVVFVSCPLSPCSSPPPLPLVDSLNSSLTDCHRDQQQPQICLQLASPPQPPPPSTQPTSGHCQQPLQNRHQHCQYHHRQQQGLEADTEWLRGCSSAPVVAANHLSAGHFFWWPDDSDRRNQCRNHRQQNQLKDFCCVHEEGQQFQQQEETMEVVQPEDDLKRLVENELKLRLSGYYYGSLGWVEASEMLKKCEVGTFLVRDSEHASYLYSLSVQTVRGPTSCRIDYHNGRFRLDSSEALSPQMPRFDSMTDLIEHYVRLSTDHHPPRTSKNGVTTTNRKVLTPVWLDLAGNSSDNKQDVPVQMYRPLYRGTRSLQHLCRVRMVRMLREARPPHVPLDRTIDEQEYQVLPTVLKDYLKEYPYSQ